MITRVVKMTFKPEHVGKFMSVFNASASMIRTFDGCYDMKLFQESGTENIYFTISKWRTESHLEAYRASTLFKKTWAQVKPLFFEKAQAWSLLNTDN